jgi:hypothetical protein
MSQRQKESEDYLTDVQIALDQKHSEVEGALRYSRAKPTN